MSLTTGPYGSCVIGSLRRGNKPTCDSAHHTQYQPLSHNPTDSHGRLALSAYHDVTTQGRARQARKARHTSSTASHHPTPLAAATIAAQ